jgi:hypothetical protein
MAELRNSNEVLDKARKGQSILDNPTFSNSVHKKTLPFLSNVQVKKDLDHYLNLSVARQTFCPTLQDGDKRKIAYLLERSPER